MNLALLMTARCNASCRHCSTSCGPSRTDSLSRDQLFSLIDEATEFSRGGLRLHLSGGEPFLDFMLLLQVLERARKAGASVSCVTNASWATSREKAREILHQVHAAGLDSLAISCSRFHLQYVGLSRAQRAFEAARELGLRTQLKYVFAAEVTDEERPLIEWLDTLQPQLVQRIPLLPFLHTDGTLVPGPGFFRKPGLPAGPCPGPVLTVREDGEAFSCCTPGAFNKMLHLGSTQTTSLRNLHDRFVLGGCQQVLRRYGPSYFAAAAHAAGLGSQLRDAYSNVCDLCTHIATDPQLAKVAVAAAEQFEHSQIDRLLRSLNPNHPHEGENICR